MSLIWHILFNFFYTLRQSNIQYCIIQLIVDQKIKIKFLAYIYIMKYLFLVNPVSDGAGDFSFTNKVITTLIQKMKVPANDIYLLILNREHDGISIFKNNYNAIKQKKPIDQNAEWRESLEQLCLRYQSVYSNTVYSCKGIEQNINDTLKKIKSMPNHGNSTRSALITYKSLDNLWNIWMNNVLRFLMPLLPRKNIKIYTDTFGSDPILPDFQLTQDDDITLFTFLIPFYRPLPEDLQKYPKYALNEGGYCEPTGFGSYSTEYTSGFSETEREKCLGINIFKIDDMDSTYKPYEVGKYHVCYFGQIDDKKETDVNALMMFRLRCLTHKMIELKIESNKILLNKRAFDILLKTEISSLLIPDIIVHSSKHIIIGNITVEYYNPINPSQFLAFLYYSHSLCILTGDQSYYEGISMGKIVYYDMPKHKLDIFRQMLLMYNHFGKASVNSYNDRSEQIVENVTNTTYYSMQTIDTITYSLDTIIYNNDQIVPFDSVLSLYNLVYDVCSPIVYKHKDKFLEWLDTYYNFDKNFITLLSASSTHNQSNKGGRRRIRTHRRSIQRNKCKYTRKSRRIRQ